MGLTKNKQNGANQGVKKKPHKALSEDGQENDTKHLKRNIPEESVKGEQMAGRRRKRRKKKS